MPNIILVSMGASNVIIIIIWWLRKSLNFFLALNSDLWTPVIKIQLGVLLGIIIWISLRSSPVASNFSYQRSGRSRRCRTPKETPLRRWVWETLYCKQVCFFKSHSYLRSSLGSHPRLLKLTGLSSVIPLEILGKCAASGWQYDPSPRKTPRRETNWRCVSKSKSQNQTPWEDGQGVVRSGWYKTLAFRHELNTVYFCSFISALTTKLTRSIDRG